MVITLVITIFYSLNRVVNASYIMPLHTDKDVTFIKNYNDKKIKRGKVSYKKYGLYAKTNKAYKKADYSNIALRTVDCKNILTCPIFGQFTSLTASGKLKKYGYGLYPTKEILDILFMREMTVYQDDMIWRKDCRRKSEKKDLMESFIIKIDGKTYNLGKFYLNANGTDFNTLALYLAKNKEIFDKKSIYHTTKTNISKIIKEHKLHFSIDNFDIKSYIIDNKNLSSIS